MKSIKIIITLVVLVIIIILASIFYNSSLRKITIATSTEYPPFGYTDDSGNLTGLDYTYGKLLCREMGASCEWKVMPFDKIIDAVAAGEADMSISSFTRTPNREQFVDFSNPYYYSFGQFTRLKGNEETELENGATVAVQSGTIYESYMNSPVFANVNLNIIVTQSQEEAFSMVGAGEADFTIADDVLVDLAVRNSPFFDTGTTKTFERYRDSIRPEPGTPAFDSLGAGEIGIIVAKHNQELLERINAAIPVTSAIPEAVTESEQYFGRNIFAAGR